MSDDIQHKATRRRIEPHVDFDFDALDPRPIEDTSIPDVLGFVLAPLKGKRLQDAKVRATVIHRLMCVAMHTNPDVFAGSVTVKAMAQRCGISDRAMRKHAAAARAYWSVKRRLSTTWHGS